MIRAQRLADLGLVDVAHPDRLSVDALSRWLAQAGRQDGGRTNFAEIDLNGLQRLPALLDDLMGQPREELMHAN